ncbi:hypothetical protein [Thalassotalea fusca]
MEDLKKHPYLLLCLVVIAIIKFAIVPIYDWQAQKLNKIALLEKRFSKIENVLENKENAIELLQKLQKNKSIETSLFFKYAPGAQFKIEQQKRLESVLGELNLQADNFAWQTIEHIDALDADMYSAELRFSGKVTNAIKLMIALEAISPYHQISDFNYGIKRQRKNDLGRVTGKITLNFLVASAVTANGESS